MQSPSRIKGIIAAVMDELLFGFSLIFTKFITSEVSPWSLIAWRYFFAFAIVFLLKCLHLFPVNLKGRNLWPLIRIAIFHPVIYSVCETFGIALTTASESATILACIPVMTLTISALFLHQKPGKWRTIGIFVTLIGVLICSVYKGFDISFSLLGYMILLIGVIAFSCYTIASGLAAEYTSNEISYVIVTSGLIVFLAIALITNAVAGTLQTFFTLPFTNGMFTFTAAYQGIGCCFLALMCVNIAIKNIGATGFASFSGLATIVSILSGVFILKESFDIPQVIGVFLILCGVYMANFIKKKDVSPD